MIITLQGVVIKQVHSTASLFRQMHL